MAPTHCPGTMLVPVHDDVLCMVYVVLLLVFIITRVMFFGIKCGLVREMLLRVKLLLILNTALLYTLQWSL